MIDLRPSRPGDVPQLRQLWQTCFGDSDRFLDLFYTAAYAPERSLVLAEQEHILGAAYWFDCTLGSMRLAYVYAVSVTPSRQGQGLGRRLMEEIHCILRRKGYAAVLLVPGQESLRRYYSGFGYRTCSHRFTQTALPPLSPICADEYARLRRTLLPENGVLQEGENLSFLSALADFYRGDHAIAALSREDGSCLELLGVPNEGPKIPYAMGKALGIQPLPDEIYFAFGFG